MIHLFNQNGYNICLDVNSGAIHALDDIAYEILEKCKNLDDYMKLRDIDGYKMDKREFREAYNEMDSLINERSLFSDIDIPEKPAVRGIIFKALCLHMAHTCNLRCEY